MRMEHKLRSVIWAAEDQLRTRRAGLKKTGAGSYARKADLEAVPFVALVLTSTRAAEVDKQLMPLLVVRRLFLETRALFSMSAHDILSRMAMA